MYSLFRSLDQGSEAGAPLPEVWKTFTDNDVRFHRGDVSMIAGPPGAGKSVMALQHALQCKVPSLYVSCDMGRYLTSVRAAAVLTESQISDLKAEMASNIGREKYRKVIADEVNHLYMAYETRPAPEQIQEIVLSFEELWGIPPHASYIDNLMNLWSGSDNEWAGLRDLSQVFHWMAGEMGSSVTLLHHTNIAGADLSKPAPLGGVKGQVTELPALVLTVAKWEGRLRIAPVKNRHGRSDPTAKKWFELEFDEPKGILRDIPPPPPPGVWTPTTSYVPEWAQ